MTPELLEMLRQTLLDWAYQVRPLHQTSAIYYTRVRAVGLTATALQVERELGYLVEKGLLAEGRSTLSAGVKHWKITAAGVEAVEGSAA